MKVSEVKARLREAGVTPSKRLGQHFLLIDELAHRMAEYAGILPGERVLEVGPGLGILTEALLDRGVKVVAVEKDRRLCAYLRDRIPGLDLLEGDVLSIELPPFDRVVSNLPYEISSPFTFRLLERSFKRAILTFQMEFAERVVARMGSGAYSRLSVKVYYRSDAQILETVPSSAFWPRPEVDSAVVQIDTRPPPFEVDEGTFDRVVDALFAHRRKKALNALLHEWRHLALSEESLRSLLADTPLATKRAEQMNPEDMACLARLLAAKG